MGSLLFFEFMYLPLEKCKNDLLNPGGSYSKESTCNVGDLGSIPDSGRTLEKVMATHFSILAWRVPWTEEPDRL